MATIDEQISAAQSDWNEAFQHLKGNPSIVESFLPGSSAEQLDEAMKALGFFLAKARAPRGFKPVYDLSNALLGRTAAELRNQASNLKGQSWGNLPEFAEALTKSLSVVHTMVAYGEKDGARETVTSLGSQMAEHLALLDTAKAELSAKFGQLQAATALVKTFEEKAAGITKTEEAIAETKEQIEGYDAEAKSALDAAKLSQATIAEHQSRAAELLRTNTELAEKLEAAGAKLTELQDRSDKQQKFIESLMPKATDAGVSHAFGTRVRELNWTKWAWFTVFAVSLGALAVMAWYLVVAHSKEAGEQLWQHALYRIPLAAPLIWLGWFSAIQYGNAIRLQEDYAFKEATSKAFVGYRDYFKTISTDSEDEDADPDENPLKVLAAETIKITSKDPLRVLGRAADEASPAKGLLARSKDKNREG